VITTISSTRVKAFGLQLDLELVFLRPVLCFEFVSEKTGLVRSILFCFMFFILEKLVK